MSSSPSSPLLLAGVAGLAGLTGLSLGLSLPLLSRYLSPPAPLLPPYEPPRVQLALLPTRIATNVCVNGVEIDIKADNETGCELSGNKVRKLEYLLADALSSGASCVVTNGGAQSNFARATTLAAVRLNLAPLLVLRKPHGSPSADLEDLIDGEKGKGNLFLSSLAGASVTWMDAESYADPNKRKRAMVDAGRAAGFEAPYVIPQGGSNALGSWGYVRMMTEIDVSLYDTLAVAVGSGGTLGGILLGRAVLGISEDELEILGIAVCDDELFFRSVIQAIFDEFNEIYGTQLVPGKYTLLDQFIGDGYAIPYPEANKVIGDVAKSAGLVLDPVYSAKALYGATTHLKSHPELGRMLFVHTGGVFGTLAQADSF